MFSAERVFGRRRPFGMLMRDYGAATVVIRELFVRLTCATDPLKTSLKLPPLARAECRVNEDFSGAVTRDLFRRKYSFGPLNYIVTDSLHHFLSTSANLTSPEIVRDLFPNTFPRRKIKSLVRIKNRKFYKLILSNIFSSKHATFINFQRKRGVTNGS